MEKGKDLDSKAIKLSTKLIQADFTAPMKDPVPPMLKNPVPASDKGAAK